jgi:hypothetical protein
MSRSRQLNLTPGAVADQSPARLAGKIIHDPRGTAVWDWDVATDVLAGKTAEELLRSLDATRELKLLDVEPDAAWAGDPYNRPVR